jgi:Molecular chaperone GrpE (heat shock protein)
MTKNKKRKDQDNDNIMAENQSTAPETKSAEATQVETESGTETSIAEQQAAELAAANDKYLRLYAEFDNYKRRVSKERIELMQTAGKEIIANLLPVIDDFDRAIKAFETATELEPLKEGVSLVGQKLKNILTQQGLKEMESIGKPFDAELQEAITNVPAPSEDLKGKVIDEIEKGYFLHGKVLRHAKVVVGS